MRTEDLLEAIGNVDDDLLERSEKVKIKKQNPWKKWVPLAACFCLIIGAGWLLFPNGFGNKSANDTSSADGAKMEGFIDAPASDDYGTADGEAVLESDGLADGENASDNMMNGTSAFISANRETTLSVSKIENEIVVEVTEQYTFFNASTEDGELRFAYPYELRSDIDNVIEETDSEYIVTVPANGEARVIGSQSVVSNIYYLTGFKGENLGNIEWVVSVNKDDDIEVVSHNFEFGTKLEPVEEYYIEFK